jgi:hypothetical protein
MVDYFSAPLTRIMNEMQMAVVGLAPVRGVL